MPRSPSLSYAQRKRWTSVADNLAAAMLASHWSEAALRSAAQSQLEGAGAKLVARLVGEVLGFGPERYPPAHEDLCAAILGSAAFAQLVARKRPPPRITSTVLDPPRFAPAPRFASLDVPKLFAPGDLAGWLGITPAHLDWYADVGGFRAVTPDPALRHYVHCWVPKRSGDARLIEAPKIRLKAMQRRILGEILSSVPVHEAAFGFVAGRSCIGAAQVHAAEAVVIALDLKDFFTSVRLSRVHGLFRSLGYPASVASLLTGLCCTVTPPDVVDAVPAQKPGSWLQRRMLRSPHLPQGAPTSPALANLTCHAMDCRLQGLAARFDARYTRYADDLAFSGGDTLSGATDTFIAAVTEIVQSEGHAINRAKLRVMRRNRRQEVTGIVVNERVNIARQSYDALKATLHNCVRRGAEAENRAGHADFRAHLEGRVQWVEQLNPHRGAKLRAMLERIAW